MTVSAGTLRKLAALSLSTEQMTGVLELLAEQQEAEESRLRAQRERKARVRALSRDAGGTVSGHDVDTPPKKEIPPTPPKEKTTPQLSEASASSSNPRDALERVLDPARAAAVVDHRKRIGKPLTAYAAGLLAKKFALCPDPDAAADEMVSNGWQGFKPDWMNRPRAGPAAPKRGMDAVFGELEGFLDGQGSGEGGDETPQGAVLSVPYRHADG